MQIYFLHICINEWCACCSPGEWRSAAGQRRVSSYSHLGFWHTKCAGKNWRYYPQIMSDKVTQIVRVKMEGNAAEVAANTAKRIGTSRHRATRPRPSCMTAGPETRPRFFCINNYSKYDLRWCALLVRGRPGPAELQTKVREDFTITEKASTKASSWLKAPINAFNFKTLLVLRHHDCEIFAYQHLKL